jgi:hypothetical protein
MAALRRCDRALLEADAYICEITGENTGKLTVGPTERVPARTYEVSLSGWCSCDDHRYAVAPMNADLVRAGEAPFVACRHVIILALKMGESEAAKSALNRYSTAGR